MQIINNSRLLRSEWIILLPLALLILNFLGYAGYYALLVIVVAIFYLIPKKTQVLDSNILWLLMFGSLYVYFLDYHDFPVNLGGGILYILLPISYYIAGKYIAIKYPYIKTTYSIFYILIILLSLIPFLSNIFEIINVGFMVQRNINLIWSSKGEDSATLVSARFALNMSLFALLFVRTNDFYEKKMKMLLFILFMAGLFAITNMSTRTGIFITFLSLIAVLFLMDIKSSVKYVIYILVAFLAGFIILSSIGITSWFSNSFFYERFTVELRDAHLNDISTMPRIFRWPLVIEGFLKYPLGGSKTYIVGSYAHNLWLDVGWKTGLLPLIPLLIFTYKYVVNVFKIGRLKHYSLLFRALVICISTGFLASFMLEPVMEGMFYTFCLFCFFSAYFYQIKKTLFV